MIDRKTKKLLILVTTTNIYIELENGREILSYLLTE